MNLVDIDVSVDGEFVSSGTEPEIRGVCSSHPVQVFGGTCGGPALFTRGHHTVTAQPHIVGYPDPPPSTLAIDFDLACGVAGAAPPPLAADAGTTPPSPAPDAGLTAQHPDASTPSNAGSAAAGSLAHVQARAAPPSASSQTPPVPSSSRGCSATSHRGGGGTAAWLVMLALIGLRPRRDR